jgi:major type 1 subunit fimbrin (pilin)
MYVSTEIQFWHGSQTSSLPLEARNRCKCYQILSDGGSRRHFPICSGSGNNKERNHAILLMAQAPSLPRSLTVPPGRPGAPLLETLARKVQGGTFKSESREADSSRFHWLLLLARLVAGLALGSFSKYSALTSSSRVDCHRFQFLLLVKLTLTPPPLYRFSGSGCNISLPRFASCLLLPLLMLSGAPAHAICTATGIPNSAPFVMPSSISVPSGVAVGTIIYTSPQIVSATVNGSCDSKGGYMLVGYAQSMPAAGSLTGVYQTNLSGIGVKVVAPITNTGTPITLNPSLWQEQWSYLPNLSTGFSSAWQIQLVVTGPVTTGTLVLPPVLAESINSDSPNSLVNQILFANLTISGSTNIVVVTCTTPDVTVNMGNHSASEMSGIGSTTSSTSFSIALNACPAGMPGIQYEIDPITTIVGGLGNSVVTLDGTSTASGIGLQLLDGTGNPFTLGTPVTFSGYNSGTGGSYTIPLRARYYQTDSQIKPGSANTSMIFTVKYQ